ncbi:MAG: PACE efflux transporter [Burkholderiaceae bacterium]|nr:PACE efflux transporter [Burkholderiaceae bacterium]
MQGLARKVVYVGLYEALAIVATTAGLSALSGEGLLTSGGLAAATSAVAVVWNLLFNTIFETWERRQRVRGRSLGRRLAHAIGFEGGLVALLVPLIAGWYGIGLWPAFLMDLGLLLFFLVFTFVFNAVFDRVFGLPAAAV